MINSMKKHIGLFIISLLMGISPAFAQLKGGSDVEPEDFLEKQMQKSSSLQDLIKTQDMPVGDIINSEYYFIGPGDIISIIALPIINMEYPVKVSPDNTIIIPRIGKLDLNGMNLKKVQDTVSKLFLKRNSNALVSVSLAQARLCLVNVKGNVLNPGTFTLPASYRVSSAIRFCNQLKSNANFNPNEMEMYMKLFENIRESEKLSNSSGNSALSSYSSRNVVLLRKDGSSMSVDIEKSIAYNNPLEDPFVKEGDEIYVPHEKFDYPKISISGAVLRPITVPFKKGDKLSLLLKFGRGFTTNADVNNIYLFMPGRDSKIKVELDDSLRLIGADYDLIPGSSVIVGESFTAVAGEQGVVSIVGHVALPGNYIIEKNNTKLKEIIDNAGGFTPKAYLPLAYIIRRTENMNRLIDPHKEQWEKFQYSDLTLEDTIRYAMDMKLRKSMVSCDFQKLFDNKDDSYNVVLQDGDVIFVPENPRRVFVYGQVNNPGFVDFKPDQSMKWYINKAGGFASGAAEDRARIIRGNNKVWLKDDENIVVYAGDEIYVPRPPDVPATLQAQKYGVLASIIGAVTGVVSVLFTIYWNTQKK